MREYDSDTIDVTRIQIYGLSEKRSCDQLVGSSVSNLKYANPEDRILVPESSVLSGAIIAPKIFTLHEETIFKDLRKLANTTDKAALAYKREAVIAILQNSVRQDQTYEFMPPDKSLQYKFGAMFLLARPRQKSIVGQQFDELSRQYDELKVDRNSSAIFALTQRIKTGAFDNLARDMSLDTAQSIIEKVHQPLLERATTQYLMYDVVGRMINGAGYDGTIHHVKLSVNGVTTERPKYFLTEKYLKQNALTPEQFTAKMKELVASGEYKTSDNIVFQRVRPLEPAVTEKLIETARARL
jgi:hypothetical protein